MAAHHHLIPSVTLLAALAGAPLSLAASSPVTPYPPAFFASAQPFSAYDMVARVPGFTLEIGDSDMRGFSGASGNVLLDGKPPTSKTEGLEDILRRIPARAVARIELVRSGAAGYDLQGRAMVVNIVRAQDSSTRGSLEAALATHRRQTAPSLAGEFSRRTGERLSELSVAIRREIDDEKGRGPRRRLSPSGETLRDALYGEDKADQVAEVTAGHARNVAGGRLRLNASAKSEITRADVYETVRHPTPSTESVFERERVLSGEIGGRYDHPLADRWTLETLALLRASRTRAGDRAIEADIVTATRETSVGREAIGRALLRRQGVATTLELGAETALNSLDSHAALTQGGAAVVLPTADVRVEERRSEGFATLTWRTGERLTLEAETRLEASTLTQSGDSRLRKTFLYPKPRLQAVWTPGPNNQVRLSLARRVGQLDFEDFVSSSSLTSNTVTAGNPELEPDKTWRLTLAWDRRLPADGAIVTTLHRDAIVDVVDRVPIVGPGYAFDAPGNIGRGRRIELTVDATLPLDGLKLRGGRLKASVTSRHSRVTDPATGQPRPISDEPRLEGALHLTQDLPARRLRWGLDATLAEDKPEYRFDEVRHDRTQARVGVFAEFRPAPAWSLRLQVDNLTDGKVTRRREQYAGTRASADLKRIETRTMAHGAYAGLSVRKALGG